jgi:hypothetical protein
MIILNEKIIEKFLHHLAGKLNISNLLLELNYSAKEIIKSNKDIEGLFSLYKGVLLNKPEIINNNKIKELFENQGAKFIINNKEDFPNEKTILLYFLYEVTDDKTIIIINEDNVVYENNDELKENNMINTIIDKIKDEWMELLTSPNNILNNYKKDNNKVIFYFK